MRPRWRSGLPALALALLGGSPALADGAKDLLDGDLVIRAEVLEADGLSESGGGRLVASGGVELRRGPFLVQAPTLSFDRRARRAVLEGDVFAVDGTVVLSARRLEFDLNTRTMSLLDGRFIIKKNVTAAELLRTAQSGSAVQTRRAGSNSVSVRADRIERTAGKTIEAHGVWLTTCECVDDCIPLLSITASAVQLVPGEAARFEWPVFRLFGVPVTPPLPWITLPLSQRASGLLFPNFAVSGPGGVTLTVPVFLTLGESADVTFHPTWASGNADGTGYRGFGGATEFRWRPAGHASGRLQLSYFFDTASIASQGPAPWGWGGRYVRGHRGRFDLEHHQQLLGGRLSFAGSLLSDTSVLRDTSPRAAEVLTPYLSSRLGFSRATPSVHIAGETTVHQDLTAPRIGLTDTAAVLAPILRVGGLTQGQWGRVALDVTSSLSFEDTVRGLTLAPGRSRRALASVSTGQAVPVLAGRGGSVSVEAGQRVDAALRSGSLEGFRGGGFAGVVASGSFSRRFGEHWRHDVVPSWHLRALGTFGSLPYGDSLFAPRDEAPQAPEDMALPNEASLQSVARLETTLVRSDRQPIGLWLEHHLGLADTLDQGQVLGGARLTIADTRLLLTAALGIESRKLSQAAVRWWGPLSLSAFSMGALFLDGARNDAISRGLDLLFTPREGLGTSSPLLQADAAVNAPLFGVLSGRLRANFTHRLSLPWEEVVQQYTVTLLYDAGQCGRLTGMLAWSPGTATPLYSFGFELGDVTELAASAAQAMEGH